MAVTRFDLSTDVLTPQKYGGSTAATLKVTATAISSTFTIAPDANGVMLQLPTVATCTNFYVAQKSSVSATLVPIPEDEYGNTYPNTSFRTNATYGGTMLLFRTFYGARVAVQASFAGTIAVQAVRL